MEALFPQVGKAMPGRSAMPQSPSGTVRRPRALPRVAGCLAFCLLFLGTQASAQKDPFSSALVLRHEFWTEITPKPEFEVDPEPFDAAKPTADILAEAAFVYAGMLRGFSVSYVPYDKARSIAESFAVEAALPGAVKPEDLVRAESRVVKNYFRAYVEYHPDETESGLYSSWRAATYPVSGGEGRALLTGGAANRMKAMEDGVKDAVREYARLKVKNKPRLVRAAVAFERPPSIIAKAGNYVARVRLRIRIEEMLPYAAY